MALRDAKAPDVRSCSLACFHGPCVDRCPMASAVARVKSASASRSEKQTLVDPAGLTQIQNKKMRSGSRFMLAAQSLADLVHQRIAREGFLQEESLFQEIFVASVVFKVARHVNDAQTVPQVF